MWVLDEFLWVGKSSIYCVIAIIPHQYHSEPILWYVLKPPHGIIMILLLPRKICSQLGTFRKHFHALVLEYTLIHHHRIPFTCITQTLLLLDGIQVLSQQHHITHQVIYLIYNRVFVRNCYLVKSSKM